MRTGLPLAFPGMKIGLFGGSFDPAHEGHAHVAQTALKRLGLDEIWWLITPQNPLKPQSSPPEDRLASARKFARGAKMVVTDLETRIGTRYTIDTLRALKRLYPGVAFTFVMGADNVASFKKWKNWREVAQAVQIAVVSRPGASLRDRASAPKSWIWLTTRHHPASSTALRARKRRAVAKPGRR